MRRGWSNAEGSTSIWLWLVTPPTPASPAYPERSVTILTGTIALSWFILVRALAYFALAAATLAAANTCPMWASTTPVAIRANI